MDAAQVAALAALTPEQVATLTNLMNNLHVQPRRADTLPHIKNIPWPSYNIGEDFLAWLAGFTDNVRCAYDLPENDARLPALLLKWIVTKLSSGPTRALRQPRRNSSSELEPIESRPLRMLSRRE